MAFNITHPANDMLAIVRGCLGGIGSPGNFFLLVIIGKEYKTRHPYEWMIFLLALSDFFYCLNNATLEVGFITDYKAIECKVGGAFTYFLGIPSILMPTLITYNRYLALYDNARCTRIFTTRNVFLAWGCILLFDVSWTTPFAAMNSLGQDELGNCGNEATNAVLVALVLVMCAVLVVFYTFLVFCSVKVILKIRDHKKNAGTRSQLESRLIKESQEIITAVLIISTLPLLTQVPGAALKVAQVFMQPIDAWITRSLAAPFAVSAATNPYVTTYAIKDYRKVMKKALLILKRISFKYTASVGPSAQAGPPRNVWVNNDK